MADITVVENVVDRWVNASQAQQDFIMLRRLYPSDNKTCKAMNPPINHATPIQWRKRDENFVELERAFKEQPIASALMYFNELLPIALVTLKQAMIDGKIKSSQVEAAKAVPKLMIELEQLKMSKKNQRKLEVKWKDKYDDGKPVPDNLTVPALPSAGDNTSVSS
jgi:hypothetical protein